MSRAHITLHHLKRPMRIEFGHARASRSAAEHIVVLLEVDGVTGVGECVPREYVSGETEESVWAALTSCDLGPVVDAVAESSDLGGAARTLERLELSARLTREGVRGLAAAAALELAALDVAGKRHGRPLSSLAAELELPAAIQGRREATYPLSLILDFKWQSSAADLPLWAREEPRHLKMKAGRDEEKDLDRVRAARERLGALPTLSLDANMAWTPAEAAARIRGLRPFDVTWFEEPLARGALEDYRRLREETGARIMLDESLCSLEDAQAAVSARACDLFNIRLSKCGGFLPSLRLAELAHRHGLGFQIGVHVGESEILCAAGLQLREALAGAVSYEGGATDVLFAESLTAEPIVIDRERMTIQALAGPGLGVTPDVDRIAKLSHRSAAWSTARGWDL